jgi:hypothetical protein
VNPDGAGVRRDQPLRLAAAWALDVEGLGHFLILLLKRC